GEGIAEFAAFVDRAGGLGGDVTGDAARAGELGEESLHALLVLPDLRIDLRIGAVQPGGGDGSGTAVTGAGDGEQVEVSGDDRSIEVGVDEGETRGRAPVAQEPWLDVRGLEGLPQEWVVHQVDLAHCQIVRG